PGGPLRVYPAVRHVLISLAQLLAGPFIGFGGFIGSPGYTVESASATLVMLNSKIVAIFTK
ncbi:MAG: hypothetical protein V4501_05295, partial [Pseudomonadota bacterium]